MGTVVAVFCAVLGAAPEPSALLADVDAIATRAADSTLTLKVVVRVGDGAPLVRKLRIWQKGDDLRMVKFAEPARLRGTGILGLGGGRTYLYLPAYKRVRRIIGTQGGGSFMGTGFSINDLARVTFGGDYTASRVSDSAAGWALDLLPKAPEAQEHARLRLTVRKSDHRVTGVQSFDAKGQVLRTIEFTDFKAIGPYTVAHRVAIEERASGRRTVATIETIRYDSGLTAASFTERELRRAP
jgi:hypothetical protein